MNSWIFGPNVKEIPNDISMTGGTDCIELHLPGDITEPITVHDTGNILQKTITIPGPYCEKAINRGQVTLRDRDVIKSNG